MKREFSTVAIVHHSYTLTNMVEPELRDYLLARGSDIFYLTHPFKHFRDGLGAYSRVNIYRGGQLAQTIIGWSAAGPEFLFFLRDLAFTLYYFIFRTPKLDCWFGVDNLNALAGIMLRKLGRVRTVVYYVIDFVPQRFDSRLLNGLYHLIERYCAKQADQTWNLSDAMVAARWPRGIAQKYLDRQIAVPVGCHPLAHVGSSEPIKQLVFLGILSEEQGVMLLIDSLTLLAQELTGWKLVVIGSGNLAPALAAKIQANNLSDVVELRGFIKDHAAVNQILAASVVGLAPYALRPDSYKQFADPGKIKTYLGAGLPVIMTNISPIAAVITARQAGLVIADNPIELAQAIKKVLTDEKLYTMLQHNAAALGREYDWQHIFDRAFHQLINHQ